MPNSITDSFLPGDNDPNVQAYRLRMVEKTVSEIKRMVGEIHEKQISYVPCPNPGACIELDSRIEELECSYEQQKGAWRMLIILTTGVSTVLTFLGVEFFRK